MITAAITAADQADPDGGNNTDSADITVSSADLQVTKVVDNGTPNEGDTVTYTVTDSEGNAAAPVTRIVNVADTTAPVITLVGSTPIDVEAGTVYIDAGATATDSFEGDLTGAIVTVNPVNTSLVGTYTITYTATDAAAATIFQRRPLSPVFLAFLIDVILES